MTTRRGFRYDSGTSRLDVVVDGSVVARYNNVTPNLSVVDGLTLDGTLTMNDSAQWTANASGTVTISNVAPSGVGTATITKWLTITDNSGVVMYIPAWRRALSRQRRRRLGRRPLRLRPRPSYICR